ncbi:MAG: hypothetical protein M0Z69_06155 [Actinomycetota bacterium]|nr:hypothetical protein [Actinomycetota bacterium]
MIFVEILRLIVVLIGAVVGLSIGSSVHSTATGRFVGAMIGVLVAYVIGGVAGRLLDRGLHQMNRRLRDVPAPELLAGVFLGGIGLLVGVALCLPLFVFVHEDYDYPLCAAVAWVLGVACLRLGMAKGRQLADSARLTRRLEVLPEAVAPGAMLLDTSALMERAVLVLGRVGMLGSELLIPEPVLDEVETLAASPDPVASRRARRALESVSSLRESGVTVTVVPGDMPGEPGTEDKVLRIAERLGVRLVTCSSELAAKQEHGAAEVEIVDLRSVLADVAPDHVPGERLEVDLVRAGRQLRQAVGYLPDGDMVVVNDAEHMVGRAGVPVVVLSTRPTSQGLLVFARLAADDGTAPGVEPDGSAERPGGRSRR